LIVDDEEGIRLFISGELKQSGYEVQEANSAENALLILEREQFDVILLDLRMTGMSGTRVMGQIKQTWPETQIIILTAFATVDSAIEAVRQNAFDYLRKPCDIEVIMQTIERALEEKQALAQERLWREQIQAVTESSGPLAGAELIHTGQLVLDRGARRVTVAGRPVALTPTEYELLSLLAFSLGQPVSLETLIRQGLGYNPQEVNNQDTIRVYISRLRRKLGADYILIARTGGYLLAKLPTVA
jgi:DNA-binding response OmpR family regulator